MNYHETNLRDDPDSKKNIYRRGKKHSDKVMYVNMWFIRLIIYMICGAKEDLNGIHKWVYKRFQNSDSEHSDTSNACDESTSQNLNTSSVVSSDRETKDMNMDMETVEYRMD